MTLILGIYKLWLVIAASAAVVEKLPARTEAGVCQGALGENF